MFSGDSLLIGDVGRPDLHVAGDPRGQARSCTRACVGCSSCPTMSCSIRAITAARSAGAGFPAIRLLDRLRARPQPLLALTDPEAFADAVMAEMPPRPADQERIVSANRSGRVGAPA